MSTQPASLPSSNPFRRSVQPSSLASHKVPPIQTSSPFDPVSIEQPRLDSVPDAQPPRPKVVKKVRVQSPPPSSPETTPNTANAFTGGEDSSDDSSEVEAEAEDDDPFGNRNSELPDDMPDEPTQRPTSLPPPNPFSKTLQDIEHRSEEGNTPASTPAKGALDVNAFRRLLLTGQAGVAGPSQKSNLSHPTSLAAQQTAPPGVGDNSTETSSVSRQSIFDAAHDISTVAAVETPRSSHEATDYEEDGGLPPSFSTRPGSTGQKKKPPPPSSRHGKLIALQLKDENASINRPTSSSSSITSPSKPRSPPSPSDVNKPLPAAPKQQNNDEVEDVFDKEAAGKVPEAGPPTPPLSQTAPTLPTIGKKPTPAPPPRRHARGESKVIAPPTATLSSASAPAQDADVPPRSSLESQRSRADSFRNHLAPAPPPPRRPHAPSRNSSTLPTSPSGLSFSAISSPTPSISDAERSPPAIPAQHPFAYLDGAGATVTKEVQDENATLKVTPPPPPPARNPSTRRPASVRSLDATSRRVSGGAKEKDSAAPPPPPPPRQRGSSRGSMDHPGVGPRRPSADSVRILGSNVIEEPEPAPSSLAIADKLPEVEEPQDLGKGVDILADLDALQREIDALTGQYGKAA